jgi:hypothetical protein
MAVILLGWTINCDALIDVISTYSPSIDEYAMIGSYTSELTKAMSRSPEEKVASFREQLESGDPFIQRSAAAAIRASYDVRDQYRRTGRKLVIMVDGEICHVDPDSPLLADFSSLVPLVKQVCPLPPEEEPPGFD